MDAQLLEERSVEDVFTDRRTLACRVLRGALDLDGPNDAGAGADEQEKIGPDGCQRF